MFFNRKCILSILLFFTVSYLIYAFPVQKHLAQVNFKNYIKAQGIDENTISDKAIFKDYTQNGYTVRINYTTDPDYTYYYEYNPIYKEWPYHIMCDIYDEHNYMITVTGAIPKYPPLS